MSFIISIFAHTTSKEQKMYKKRIADKLLERKLAGKGAVLIEGPKWCGKTTTASQLAQSTLDLGDSETLRESRNTMEGAGDTSKP